MKTGRPILESIENIIFYLDRANGLGATVSDVAKMLMVSKHRTRQILDVMKARGQVVECDVIGSYHHYGLKLFFTRKHFEKISGMKANCREVYKLRQRTIFELIEESAK